MALLKRPLFWVVTLFAASWMSEGPAWSQAGGGGAAPTATNGSVAFKVNCDEIFDSIIKAVVTVEKAGKKSLVNNSNPGANEVDGGHNFPPGSTAPGVGTYYRGLLINAGWTEGTDFKVDGGTINFFGITKLDAGTNHQHLVVSGSTNSKDVPYTALTIPKEPEKKKLSLSRGPNRADGAITLVGFGLRLIPDTGVESSTSHVTVHFAATDGARAVLGKIHAALAGAGWQANLDAEGDLEISHNRQGDPIYSIYQEIEYFPPSRATTPDAVSEEPEEAPATNDDHWVFSLGAAR